MLKINGHGNGQVIYINVTNILYVDTYGGTVDPTIYMEGGVQVSVPRAEWPKVIAALKL